MEVTLLHIIFIIIVKEEKFNYSSQRTHYKTMQMRNMFSYTSCTPEAEKGGRAVANGHESSDKQPKNACLIP